MSSKAPVKKGRPTRDLVFRYRTLFWYWAVRDHSQLKDGKLDLLFGNEKRDYADRIRIFEDLRKSGSSISEKEHKRRNFKLLDVVNDKYPGSADIYLAPLWESLANPKPNLKSTLSSLISLISKCKLNDIEFTPHQEPTLEEIRQVSKMFGYSEQELIQQMEPETKLIGREDYDNLLSNYSVYVEVSFILPTKVDYELLIKYLNHFTFFIEFYRYALFTGNHAAMVSAADFVKEHLSFLLLDIKWLDKTFRKALFHLIHARVFMGGSSPINLRSLTEASITKVYDDSALNQLFVLLERRA